MCPQNSEATWTRICAVPYCLEPANRSKWGWAKYCQDHRYGRGAVLKEQVLENAAYKRTKRRYPTLGPCERCGAEGENRHHRDRNPANTEPDNIEILCVRCHRKEHPPRFTVGPCVDCGKETRTRLSVVRCRKCNQRRRQREKGVPARAKPAACCIECGAEGKTRGLNLCNRCYQRDLRRRLREREAGGVGSKYRLRGRVWVVVRVWSEGTRTGEHLRNVLWVRLRREQDSYEIARPFAGHPGLKNP